MKKFPPVPYKHRSRVLLLLLLLVSEKFPLNIPPRFSRAFPTIHKILSYKTVQMGYDASYRSDLRHRPLSMIQPPSTNRRPSSYRALRRLVTADGDGGPGVSDSIESIQQNPGRTEGPADHRSHPQLERSLIPPGCLPVKTR
uniref:Putative secreted protein n=1 Tax=Anopheles darlingi TaxID=43151 RepID=A0A2M4D4Z4_ANODA